VVFIFPVVPFVHAKIIEQRTTNKKVDQWNLKRF